MILIGQYDSPFVRRVGIALTLYGLPFEHKPWSVFGDADKIRPFNPLVRVPVLVLDDGMSLIDSPTILDHLDARVAPDRALAPRIEPARRQVLRIAALATGMADKAVALFYEQRLHAQTSPVWVERCRTQIIATAATLEADRAERATPYWFGDTITHADIAVAVALRFVADAHPSLLPLNEAPALAAHAKHLEALPVFQAIAQPFIPPT